MEMNGSRMIAADRETVWKHLNSAETLQACIPGCQELEGSPEEGFQATVVQKVGPVKATLKGEVTLQDVNAPESYKLVGEGKGGVAGFAKGGEFNKRNANKLMRWRIYAQGVAIAVILVYIWFRGQGS